MEFENKVSIEYAIERDSKLILDNIGEKGVSYRSNFLIEHKNIYGFGPNPISSLTGRTFGIMGIIPEEALPEYEILIKKLKLIQENF